MALQFPDPGVGLTRDATFLDPALDWTICRWISLPTPTTTAINRVVLMLGPDSDFTAPYVWLGHTVTPPDLLALLVDNGSVAADASAASILDAWAYVALRYKASTTMFSVVVDGVEVTTLESDFSAVTPMASEFLGYDTGPDAGEENGLSVTYARAWQAWLTADELLAEREALAAVRVADLLADTPLVTVDDLTDLSGEGQDWTAVGEASEVDGPVLDPVPEFPPEDFYGEGVATFECASATSTCTDASGASTSGSTLLEEFGA